MEKNRSDELRRTETEAERQAAKLKAKELPLGKTGEAAQGDAFSGVGSEAREDGRPVMAEAGSLGWVGGGRGPGALPAGSQARAEIIDATSSRQVPSNAGGTIDAAMDSAGERTAALVGGELRGTGAPAPPSAAAPIAVGTSGATASVTPIIRSAGGGDGGGSSAGAIAHGPASLKVAGANSLSINEDDTRAATGVLTVTGGGGVKSWVLGPGTGRYGAISLDADGHWQYQLDNSNPTVQALGAGQHLTERFIAYVTDAVTGQVQIAQLSVAIRGMNDSAVISGVDGGTATEDLSPHCAGKLDVADIDKGEAEFRAGDVVGQYGTLHLAADGSWTYDLDATVTQSLGAGVPAMENLTIRSADGTEHVVTVVVIGTNDAPVMTILAPLAADEGGAALTGRLSATDIDAGDTFGFSLDTPVAGFTLRSDGSYSFDPSDAAYDHLKPGERLTLEIPVAVDDGHGGRDTRHLQINLTGTEDAPTLQVAPIATNEDAGAIRGRFAGLDADVGDVLVYGTPNPVAGFKLAADGSYTFDPSDPAYQHLGYGEQLVLQIPVTVTDVAGARATQTLQITVTGTNDLPLLQILPPIAVFEGAPPLQGKFAAIDADEHDTLTFRAGAPIAGFTIHSDGSYTFDASDPAYNHLAFGQKQIVTVPIEVVDSAGGIAASQIQITVTGTNDAPTLTVQPPRQVNEGDGVMHGQLAAADPDTGDMLTFSVGRHVPGFTLNADGSYSFDPSDAAFNDLSAGQKAIVTVPVIVTDQHGNSDASQIQITVTGTNDGAIVGGIDHAMGSIADAHGGRLQISERLVTIDLDQGESHFQPQVLAGSYGVLEIKQDGAWTYTADAANPTLAALTADAQVPEHFTVRTADGTTHDIDIKIKGSNAPAIIAGVSSAVVTEDQPGSVTQHLSVRDPNAGESAFTPMDRATQFGHFAITADGDWTYTLDNANPAVQALTRTTNLTESILVGSVDGTPQVVTVTIMGADDGAVISGTHTGDVREDVIDASGDLTASGQLSIVDPDANQEHFVAMRDIQGDSGLGTFSIDADGHWTYAADNSQPAIQSLPKDHTTTDSVTFMAVDGTRQTITVTITGTDDAPIVTATTAAPVALGATTEDTAHRFTQAELLRLVGASDVDSGDSLTIANIGADAAVGSFARQANGDWVFTPAANVHRNGIALTLTVNDAHGGSTIAHGTLDISPVTDAPSPTLTVMAQQQVMEFPHGQASGVVNTNPISAGGAMHALTVDMTILGGQQVATSGIHGATFISYATPSDSDNFYIWNPDNFTLRIGGTEYRTGIALLGDSHDHRYTFSWNGATGTLDVLIDGQVVKHMTGVGQGATIPDGGKFALGNDQDSFGGGFSANDAFSGKYFNVAIAKQALDPQQLAHSSTANLLAGQPALLCNIIAQNGQIVDAIGHMHFHAIGGVATTTVEVDTAIASPNPGALLKLSISEGAPSDLADHVVRTTLHGFVDGTVVSDGHGHKVTVSGSAQVVDITGWNYSGLQAQLPPGAVANMALGLDVTTTGPDGVPAHAGTVTPVVLDPGLPTPDATIAGDDTRSTDDDTSVSGVLTVADGAASDAHFTPMTDIDGHYGKFDLSQDGHWTYSPDDRADALNPGQHAIESFLVRSADGTEHEVIVSLTGTDDAPVIAPAPPPELTHEPDPAPLSIAHDGGGIDADAPAFLGSDTADMSAPIDAPTLDHVVEPLAAPPVHDYLDFAGPHLDSAPAQDEAAANFETPVHEYLDAAGVALDAADAPPMEPPPLDPVHDIAPGGDATPAPEESHVDDLALASVPLDPIEPAPDEQQHHGI